MKASTDVTGYKSAIAAILRYLKARGRKMGWKPDLNNISTSKWSKSYHTSDRPGQTWEKDIFVEDSGIGTLVVAPVGYPTNARWHGVIFYPLSYTGKDGRALVAGSGTQQIGTGLFKTKKAVEEAAKAVARSAVK